VRQVSSSVTCLTNSNRTTSATFGERCEEGNLQLVCNLEDGFALGFCGPNNICRPICASDDECTAPGETCRLFTFEPGGLGYCGPEPVDE
ncbi:MAG: hypothetical protein AAFX99_10710, partial [Myxococcota bacterium]